MLDLFDLERLRNHHGVLLFQALAGSKIIT
jgi:hypothetical protein